MRIGRVLLTAAVAALMMTGAANAAGNAWFELLNDGGTGATSTGGSGQTLIIDKDGVTPGNLTIGFFLDTAGEGIFGYALATSAAAGASYNVGATAWAGGDGSGFTTHAGVAAAGLASLQHAGSAAVLAAPAGLMFTFDLVIDKPFIGSTEIFAQVGGNGIAAGAYAWNGSWGANSPVDGTPGTAAGALPVIIVNNVPEPATVALLGLGAVALIRRRR